MKKIIVAFICDFLEIGGQEMVCLNMLSWLDRRRFAPTVYAFRGGALVKDMRRLGVKVVLGSSRDPLKKEWTPIDSAERVAFSQQLMLALRRSRTDVALVFAWPDGAMSARQAGVPVVIEEVDGETLIGKIKNKAVFDRIVCQSERTGNIIAQDSKRYGCSKKQIEVINNGIDIKTFTLRLSERRRARRAWLIGEDEVVIGYVGRIDPIKNLSLLVEVARVLVKRYRLKGFKIMIVGPDRGDLARLRRMIRTYGLGHIFIFTGARRDIARMLSIFDLFAMASFTEVIPIAMMEAMAMGLPVVSTRVGSIPEIIDGNGILVDGFDPEVYAKKMHMLIEDEKLRKKMGRRSAEIMKKYDIRRLMKQYEKLFVDCLKKKSSKGRI